MTLVALAPTPLWIPPHAMSGFSGLTIDANDEKAAFIFQAPKTGNIDRVCYRTGAVTSSAANLDVRLETVDASTGMPTGTLVSVNSNNTHTGQAANTWYERTLTAAGAVTKGVSYAIVIAQPGASPSNLNVAIAAGTGSFPYTALYTGSWAKNAAFGIGAVRYDDATYPTALGLMPFSALASETYADSTNPDERGNKYTVAHNMKIGGMWFVVTTGNVGDFTAKLYDNAGNLAASKAIPTPVGAGSNGTLGWVMFDAEVTVNAGDVIRLSKRATTATNTSIYRYTNNSGLDAANPIGGGSMVYTTRNNDGAWSDTANATASVGPIVTAHDDGASVGAGIRMIGSSVARSVI